jgi:hypothetical protein
MNVLVPFLRNHPEAVDVLVGPRMERVPPGRLTDVLVGFPFPYRLEVDFEALKTGPLGGLLADAFLRVVPAERWHSQLEPVDRNLTSHAGEWATFVGGATSDYGLALPHDDGDTRRVSLFVPIGESVERVSLEYDAVGGRLTGLSVSAATVSGGCSLPDWGACRGKECGGDCRIARVHRDPNGLVCRCPHGLQAVGREEAGLVLPSEEVVAVPAGALVS